ncbi:TPA: hypothetical protein ACGJUA_002409 [Pseudomonas aeruginosa]|uniref:hypothetical protein n=1 Tax=Pseudomonas aeruginosa TaxID=287 RepID=UPI00053D4401|nr:hypothetical protein [Pseudomonas aeruginosa]AYZ83495.1 hypothetical protein EGY27_11805 [Pseudomonas aeruginosa]AYZ84346.1 hypothetical protein EGY27_16330 [Pseudomonas aeruginosa]KJC16626.1 hypothetical protein TO65_21505 [Pseudomonas aeruginosa]KYO83617.1 hypothetical protein LT19_05514 [Pseudomonas aeruginosa]MDQ9100391.1 hypothetical protein [Pseudomonas aeruginosa]
MSEVKRFDHVNHAHIDDCEHVESSEGAWVTASDYDALAAETQALREEVAALRARVVVVPDAANDRRKSAHYCRGWNACLDELARINGLTVSEGLLRSALTHAHNRGYLAGHHDTVEAQFSHILSSELDSYRSEQVEDILQALLGEGKEHE